MRRRRKRAIAKAKRLLWQIRVRPRVRCEHDRKMCQALTAVLNYQAQQQGEG